MQAGDRVFPWRKRRLLPVRWLKGSSPKLLAFTMRMRKAWHFWRELHGQGKPGDLQRSAASD
jgi:hypothetical protein